MKVKEWINKIKNVAENYNTIYGKGGFGHPCTVSSIDNFKVAYPDWYTSARENELKELIGKQYFIFDCVCFIKAILFWGWTGNTMATYGGATYDKNTDYTEKGLLNACSSVSNDFNSIVPGELVYMPGHVGVYVGEGQVVECSPKWKNSVQYSNLGNLEKYKTGNYRVWTSHGKLPGVEYSSEPVTSITTVVQAGEGYWQIAERCLGDGNRYKELQELNGNKVLFAGDTVLLPGTEVVETSDTQYEKFILKLKSALGLSASATTEQVFEKTPLLCNTNTYSKVTAIVQEYLIVLGFSCGSKGANGYFGNDTEKAVKAYQAKYTGIADGIMSEKGMMWKHILKI